MQSFFSPGKYWGVRYYFGCFCVIRKEVSSVKTMFSEYNLQKAFNLLTKSSKIIVIWKKPIQHLDENEKCEGPFQGKRGKGFNLREQVKID